MKFRIKFNTQTNLMTFDQSTIEQLKAQIQTQFSSLKKANFHLSRWKTNDFPIDTGQWWYDLYSHWKFANNYRSTVNIRRSSRSITYLSDSNPSIDRMFSTGQWFRLYDHCYSRSDGWKWFSNGKEIRSSIEYFVLIFFCIGFRESIWFENRSKIIDILRHSIST